MKTIGLLGGMSWESTVHYYQLLNQEVVNRLGGLLGTKYTMADDFYIGKMEERGLKVVVPDEEDIETVNNVIFNELCLGWINERSHKKYIEIINKLKEKGAEGVILGCTEIGMLVHQDDVDIPVFDTTVIHAKRAAETAMEE